MKTLGFLAVVVVIVVIVFTGCATRDPIYMRETPLRLTQVAKIEYSNKSNLTLQWQSLDGYIRIRTEAPIEDSNLYRVGSVYSRCFLRR